MEKQLILRHEELELAATLHYPVVDGEEQAERKPIVIICHGFIGSRIGVDRLFVKTARHLASQGSFVLRFDYGGCGESSGHYGSLGFTSMVEQTRSALDYALSMDCVDPQRVTLLGHSLGGAVALHTAVTDKRVTRLIMWSSVGYPFNDIVRIVGRSGYDEAVLQGATDHKGFTLEPSFFDSLQHHQPFQVAPRFSGDVLLVHGTSDDVIPADYSFLYQKMFWMRGDGHCDKEIIFQADHTYSTLSHQEQAIRHTGDWLLKLGNRRRDSNWSI